MKILLVCLGNICRSPMAEGILRAMIAREGLPWITDSAGTIDHHSGEAPDPRAIKVMKARGIDISDLRARQLRADDFKEFDVLFAMDESNLRNMLAIAPDKASAKKARLVMDLAPRHALREVPDPYFGGEAGFVEVYDMLTQAFTNFVMHGER